MDPPESLRDCRDKRVDSLQVPRESAEQSYRSLERSANTRVRPALHMAPYRRAVGDGSPARVRTGRWTAGTHREPNHDSPAHFSSFCEDYARSHSHPFGEARRSPIYFRGLAPTWNRLGLTDPTRPLSSGPSDARWSSLVARRAHNPKVEGSNPSRATTDVPRSPGLPGFRRFRSQYCHREERAFHDTLPVFLTAES